jgi:hypothetical protein
LVASSERPTSQRLTAALDGVYMGFYARTHQSLRRIARLFIAFLPLMMLLVGSCKTNQADAGNNVLAGIDGFRAALFPDRALARPADYRPAPGFVGRAQDFVESDPATLMQLTEQEVGFLFGSPAMQRRDADARVWQYQSHACVVDFYFYDQPGRTGESRVAYVDYRPRDLPLATDAAGATGAVPPRFQSRCLRKIAL